MADGIVLKGYHEGYGFRRLMRIAAQAARGGPGHVPAHHPRKRATEGRRRLFDEKHAKRATKLRSAYETILYRMGALVLNFRRPKKAARRKAEAMPTINARNGVGRARRCPTMNVIESRRLAKLAAA